MTVIVTRDVESRYRGFLASVMLEIAPGIFVSPDMNSSVRVRIWQVMQDWHDKLGRGAITMISTDKKSPSGLALMQLGTPPYEIRDIDGLWLARRELLD